MHVYLIFIISFYTYAHKNEWPASALIVEMKLQLKFKGHGQSEKPSNQSNK